MKKKVKKDVSSIASAREHFLKIYKNSEESMYEYHERHVKEVEKWAKILLEDFPKADNEVVLLSVWLHDIGHYLGDPEVDHAVDSEKEVLKFLPKIGLSKIKVKKVAHCIRSHRNKDIKPQTLEAKILVAADSASHMTDILYIDLCMRGFKDYVLKKLERDYHDVGLISGLQIKIEPLYIAWKSLIVAFPDSQQT